MDDISAKSERSVSADDDETSDTKMVHMIENLCNKLRCSMIAKDLKRVAKARDLLTKFQHREIFERILGPGEYDADFQGDMEFLKEPDPSCSRRESSKARKTNENLKELLLGEEWWWMEAEDYAAPDYDDLLDDLPENSWHGYFHGYQILTEETEFNIGEGKKCIEVALNICDDVLEGYIRSGVTCFCIDLFVGSIEENEQFVIRIRQIELKVSKEIGYLITTTLLAKLSPRLQYTGDLNPYLLETKQQLVLQKDDEVVLTVRRALSTSCTKEVLYVNATFLMVDVCTCDIICIGPDIQVIVKENEGDDLLCRVLIGGVLQSRMPVLFPAKCDKFHISVEELEDITFCKEVGINIVVSRVMGNQEYFDDLHKALQLFKCEAMRLWAGAALNELQGCDDEYKWASDAYHGFLFELTSASDESECKKLFLCPAAEKLIDRTFHLKKPIILDATTLSLKQYVTDPANDHHIFYNPEKFMLKCGDFRSSFDFFLLQSAITAPFPKKILSQTPYCDESFTGSDSLARSTVAAAFEMHATAIFVLGVTGRMAIKLAHFRPSIPIILITEMKSVADFVHTHQNVTVLLYTKDSADKNHKSWVCKHLLYGLSYAHARKIIRHDDNVVFVFAVKSRTKFPDKYISYKFNKKHFVAHLEGLIYDPGFFWDATVSEESVEGAEEFEG